MARMLVGNLVLTWVHSPWADNELPWETHRVGIVPAATVAMTRRAESLSQRFQGALRPWESYCRRTRSEVTAFPTRGANRIPRRDARKVGYESWETPGFLRREFPLFFPIAQSATKVTTRTSRSIDSPPLAWPIRPFAEDAHE